jgi:hypothetical protein
MTSSMHPHTDVHRTGNRAGRALATGSTTFQRAFNQARQFKALDVISHGRADGMRSPRAISTSPRTTRPPCSLPARPRDRSPFWGCRRSRSPHGLGSRRPDPESRRLRGYPDRGRRGAAAEYPSAVGEGDGARQAGPWWSSEMPFCCSAVRRGHGNENESRDMCGVVHPQRHR